MIILYNGQICLASYSKSQGNNYLPFILTGEVKIHELSKTLVELLFFSYSLKKKKKIKSDYQGIENGRSYSQNFQRHSNTIQFFF